MAIDPVELPEAKPAYEWVRGRLLQKMSPSRPHAILQRVFLEILYQWADRRGWVGSEWRFTVTPQGEAPRSLVPDVAYISAERLASVSDSQRDYPPIAPDIVVEILSPGDRPADVAHKRDVYLSAGSALVLIVDPVKRTLLAMTPGEPSREFRSDEIATLPTVPSLTIVLAAVFAQLDAP